MRLLEKSLNLGNDWSSSTTLEGNEIQWVLICDKPQRGRSPPVDVKGTEKILVGIVVKLAAYNLYIIGFPYIYMQ